MGLATSSGIEKAERITCQEIPGKILRLLSEITCQYAQLRAMEQTVADCQMVEAGLQTRFPPGPSTSSPHAHCPWPGQEQESEEG